MAIPNEIRSKQASQHHNAVQKVLIKAIPFDTEIMVQFIGAYSSVVKKPEAERR
jgi:hypothetical protein